MTQTWTDRERRMLEVIREGEEAGEELELTMLAERVRFDPDDSERNLRLVKLTLGRLLRAGFIDGTVQGSSDDPMFMGFDFVLLDEAFALSRSGRQRILTRPWAPCSRSGWRPRPSRRSGPESRRSWTAPRAPAATSAST